jgi:uncharacterized membrane protein
MNERHEAGDEDVRRLRTVYANNLDNRLQAAALGLAAMAAMLSPLLLRWLVAAIGVRPLALLLVTAGASSMLRGGDARARMLPAAAAIPAALSLVTGEVAPLRWIPALLYAALAVVFAASLREPVPVVERVARIIQPWVPDFVAPYCRRVTLLWACVFAVNALVLGASAAMLPAARWEAVAGYGIWTWMGAVAVAEFFVRKTYFRNYWYRGPFERLWSRLFPAEATTMGRRSAAYIREMRRKLDLED